MTAKIFVFAGNNSELRQIDIEGDPWFPAVDVCRALELDVRGGAYVHIQKLDTDEQRRLTRADYPSFDYGSRVPSLVFVNESGLYKLIMRSDKPVARDFQNWVTREVLPAIRKTGGSPAVPSTPIYSRGTRAGTAPRWFRNPASIS